MKPDELAPVEIPAAVRRAPLALADRDFWTAATRIAESNRRERFRRWYRAELASGFEVAFVTDGASLVGRKGCTLGDDAPDAAEINRHARALLAHLFDQERERVSVAELREWAGSATWPALVNCAECEGAGRATCEECNGSRVCGYCNEGRCDACRASSDGKERCRGCDGAGVAWRNPLGRWSWLFGCFVDVELVARVLEALAELERDVWIRCAVPLEEASAAEAPIVLDGERSFAFIMPGRGRGDGTYPAFPPGSAPAAACEGA